MKKSIIAFFLITLVLALSGCVQGKIHITVNEDGSGDVAIRMGMNSTLVALAGEGGDPFDEMIKNAEKEGYTVSRFNEGELMGFQAKKHFENIKDSFDQGALLNNKIRADKGNFSIKKGLFFDTYNIKTFMDMTSLAVDQNATEEEKAMQRAMLNQIKFDLAMTLPVKAEYHNASMVIDDGRTYVWNLIPGKNNEIILEAKVLNTRNTGIAVAAVILIVIVAVLVIVRKKGQQIHSFSVDN
ncbi:Protein of unknown function (DUF3153) (plasmid) [Carboxydocella thermautotrophica]|nr:Protein of unknown function (DUF3153) [Carboxydocella thermautotrophica]